MGKPNASAPQARVDKVHRDSYRMKRKKVYPRYGSRGTAPPTPHSRPYSKVKRVWPRKGTLVMYPLDHSIPMFIRDRYYAHDRCQPVSEIPSEAEGYNPPRNIDIVYSILERAMRYTTFRDHYTRPGENAGSEMSSSILKLDMWAS